MVPATVIDRGPENSPGELIASCRRILTRWLDQLEAWQLGKEVNGRILDARDITAVSQIYWAALRERVVDLANPLDHYSKEQLLRMRDQAMLDHFADPKRVIDVQAAITTGNGHHNGNGNGSKRPKRRRPAKPGGD